MQRESKLKKQFLIFCKCQSIVAFKNTATHFPDWSVLKKGKIVFVELKDFAAELREGQKLKKIELEKNGFKVLVIKSPEDFHLILASLTCEKKC